MRYVAALLFCISLYASQKPLDKVSIQLQWLDQFQFAGYYMAQEKGFYKEAGLDVEIKKYGVDIDIVEEVLSRKTTYGIGRSSLVWYNSKGKKITLLSATFQSSPMVLLALKSSNIKSIKDFTDKKIMMTIDALESAPIYAMIRSAQVDDKRVNFVNHSLNFEDLIQKKVDLYAGYSSNEPFMLKEREIDFEVFSPLESGFDFYSDILFTSQEEAEKNPERTKNFKDASIRGWEYAFKNIDETVSIIYEKYNPLKKSKDALKFEALELKKLAYINEIPLGTIEKDKIRRILDVYRIMGLVGSNIDIDEFIFNQDEIFYTQKEREFLKEKKELRVCAISRLLPFSDIKEDKFIGICSDVLNLTKEHVKIPYKIIYASSWEENLKNLKNNRCDILPMGTQRLKKESLLVVSPYYNEQLAVVTKKSQNYIVDIKHIFDKKFVAIKGNPFIEELKIKYPMLNISYVKSLQEGFESVEQGDYYGYIDTLISAAYAFKNISNGNLKISGSFDEKIGVGFGFREDDKELHTIFQKVSKEIKSSDVDNIINKWISVNYIKSIKFEYLQEILSALFLITLLFFYRQHLSNKKNKELEALKNELQLKVKEAIADIQKKDIYMLHKSRLAQMGEMISMVAHQWKQPLSSISALQISLLMTIELEEYDLSDEKQREDFLLYFQERLKKIGKQTQALSMIISDFSDFYKPNKQQELIALNNLVLKAYKLLEDNLQAEEIDLCLELGSKNSVLAYKNEFIQVLLNVINNAREQLSQRNRADAQILIKSYDRDDICILEISDNGGGVDESIKDKIFDPYFSTKFDKNGTGLGLHMSKSIIEQHHGGKIYLQNIENGAKFIIELQASEDKDEK
ncbi:histidine kinase [Sulfurimonas denitrificans DSM 1251]|uniref:histidine kinase n=1 Tax=Sulfurimonas denitrificans (strain ATCC 33889 / DSM 1251) TaxID=326298 RepID=Q30UL4_SULDN|nr:ABC transporter substrate-binding protein [Sulfurimonas denitrificans]ABB43317.1 histidine kinase [Sulfurimonas denitrificans DSM 1251]